LHKNKFFWHFLKKRVCFSIFYAILGAEV